MGKTYWYPDSDKDLYGCNIEQYICSEADIQCIGLIDFVTFNQFGKSLLCVYRNDKK